ncbi:transglycosylase SLT domain-containing protein [Bdellovibrio bacteriovorus]|nr:transglycosylase SLT domain-containing protein [Bdellovibrio bacteriovorus]
MKATTPHLYKMLFLTLCFSMGWNMKPVDFHMELASKEEKGLAAPFTLGSSKSMTENNKIDETASEPIPIIEHALDKIEKTKSFQSLFGWGDNVANRNCDTCQEEIRNMRYMQCNAQNNYLEAEMKTAVESQSSLLGDLIRAPIKSNSIIKASCIQMGMNTKFGVSSKTFRQCNAAGAARQAFRPCISENYFKMVNNSFELVSSCMKDFIAPGKDEETQNLDVRAVYALINIESGFHVNAMSGTGAGGIGQFTAPAIQDVNSNELNAVRISLEGNKNPLCGRLSMELLDKMEPMRAGKAQSCDRISLKNGNPMKNMIYTYAYLKGVKADMNNMIFENKNYKNKFRMSEFDLNKIKRALMVWSHNTGPAGTWTPAKTLLNSFYRGKTVTNADQFIQQMQQYMQKFPASANKSSARRKETSRYFPEITKTLNNIENAVGGGTCVN